VTIPSSSSCTSQSRSEHQNQARPLGSAQSIASSVNLLAANGEPCRVDATQTTMKRSSSRDGQQVTEGGACPMSEGGGNDRPRHAAAGSLSTRDRRNRCVSLIADPGGDPLVVAQLDRSTSWCGGVRLGGVQVRHDSTLGKRVDTQSAAAGDRPADRPQVRCVPEPRALEVRPSWPQHTSESHP
jgi:hypothetical protein